MGVADMSANNMLSRISRSSDRLASAFSLIEVILTMAIFLAIAGLSAPLAFNAFYKNELQGASGQYAQSLRHASSLAKGMKADSNWGVYIDSGYILSFKGQSYLLRDTTFDSTTSIASTIIISGTKETVFSKESGLPLSSGTTTLVLGSQTSTVYINGKGTVFYNP
jgi:type II secretory pathway pseudopilin PulG